jgi:hypothetical protein
MTRQAERNTVEFNGLREIAAGLGEGVDLWLMYYTVVSSAIC